jgi:hypothetical protein
VTGLLRVMGLMFLVCGLAVGTLSALRLPDAVPAGRPPEIVHIADFQEDPPRSHYVHLRGAQALPFASVTLCAGRSDVPRFVLVPLVDERHPLKQEMERRAARVVEEGEDALDGWNDYVESRLDFAEVRLVLLSEDVGRWADTADVVVTEEWIEGVVRPAQGGLADEVVALLDTEFRNVPERQLMILYAGEIPPEEEALRLLVILSGLAALLGMATLLATWIVRRPRGRRR